MISCTEVHTRAHWNNEITKLTILNKRVKPSDEKPKRIKLTDYESNKHKNEVWTSKTEQ